MEIFRIVRAHLLKINCQGDGLCVVTPKVIIDMQKLEDETNIGIERKTPKNVPLPSKPPQSYHLVELL